MARWLGEELDSGVCRSVGRPCGGARATENKKSSPLLSSRMALNFEGVSRWPKNRVVVFPPASNDAAGSSTSTNHWAKRLLLTGYLLGSAEGGTNSPLNLTSHPCRAFFHLVPRLGDKICGYSLFLDRAVGVDDSHDSTRSFPRGRKKPGSV